MLFYFSSLFIFDPFFKYNHPTLWRLLLLEICELKLIGFFIFKKMQEANEKSATRKGATFQTDRSSFFDKLFENKM